MTTTSHLITQCNFSVFIPIVENPSKSEGFSSVILLNHHYWSLCPFRAISAKITIKQNKTFISLYEGNIYFCSFRYIKLNGELGMHKKLSKDRPCHRCITVKCPHQVSQVCCHQGIVWALTTERNIIVRVGITADREEGTDWLFLQGY